MPEDPHPKKHVEGFFCCSGAFNLGHTHRLMYASLKFWSAHLSERGRNVPGKMYPDLRFLVVRAEECWDPNEDDLVPRTFWVGKPRSGVTLRYVCIFSGDIYTT